MAVLDSPQGQESAASRRQDRLSTEQIPSAMHGKEERTQGSMRSCEATKEQQSRESLCWLEWGQGWGEPSMVFQSHKGTRKREETEVSGKQVSGQKFLEVSGKQGGRGWDL